VYTLLIGGPRLASSPILLLLLLLMLSL